MGETIEVGSEAYKEIMRQAYGDPFLKIIDLLGRQDFYGIVAEEGVRFCTEKLGLSADSHLLELCSGIGGPARFMARTYGCKVTGIDINDFSCGVAEERTRKAGLAQQVSFHCGNALEIPFPDASFTHVFGCDAWSYMPDKKALYQAAYRALKPGGRIAFLDLAENGGRLEPSRWEQTWGSYHPESLEGYTALLESAGFRQIEHWDTSQLAARESFCFLNRLIKRKDQVVEATGLEAYIVSLETWAEILAEIELGQVIHCCFVACKP